MSADILQFRRPPRRRRPLHRLSQASWLLPWIHGMATAALLIAVWAGADFLFDGRTMSLGEVLAISKLSIGAVFGSWLRGQDWGA